MELDDQLRQATEDYVRAFASTRKPKDLVKEHVILKSEILSKAGLTDKQVPFIQAIIRELISPDGKYYHLANLDNLEGFPRMVAQLQLQWKFRYNKILAMVEYFHDGEWQPVNQSNLEVYLNRNRVAFKQVTLQAWLGSDEIEMYHPLYEYFKTLPKWDGIDYIHKFCDMLTIEDPDNTRQSFFTEMIRKHFVRMLRQALDGVENRYVVTLQSDKESLGKSHLVRWLNPLHDDYFYEVAGDFKIDKDVQIPLTTSFICLIDEIEISKKNGSALKNLISANKFKVRRPYGKNHEVLTRMASFFATCNTKEYLGNDKNTRYLSFSVDAICKDYDDYVTGAKLVPKEQLWAQIYHLYQQGEKGILTHEETRKQLNINAEFTSQKLAVQFVLKNYKFVTDEEFRMKSKEAYLVSTYDLYCEFDMHHKGYGLSQLGRELNGMVSTTDSGLTIQLQKRRCTRYGKKETVYNLVKI